MRIIVATNNLHKIHEVKELLNSQKFEVYSLTDVGFQDEIIENGVTFLENAQLKVDTIKSLFPNDIIVGDDSGFSIQALDDKPGINSARFLGSEASDLDRNIEILRLMKDLENRKAMFYCAMVLRFNQRIFQTQQVVYGTVATKLMGEQGFGYDPIFIPKGYSESFAQNHELKRKISHRALALREIVNYVEYLQN